MISPLIYSHADYVMQNNKNQETIPSRFFPEQKTKKSFVLRHLSPVHKVLTGIWKPLSGQIVSSSIHLVRESVHKCTFDRQSGNFQNYASGNHVSTSACMLRIGNWSPSAWLVYGHFIQIHSCMGICFSCMYTKNHEHFHKWFDMFTGIQC